jgi:hypothetical protein
MFFGVWPITPLSSREHLRIEENESMKSKTAVAAIVACLALAVPSAALAISPTQDAYGGVAGQQESGGNSGNQSSNNTTSPEAEVLGATTESEPATEAAAAVATPEASGSLPFTGLEVGVIALVGLALIGGGVMLYRTSRHNQQGLQG